VASAMRPSLSPDWRRVADHSSIAADGAAARLCDPPPAALWQQSAGPASVEWIGVAIRSNISWPPLRQVLYSPR
jgi:hypothetical protein